MGKQRSGGLRAFWVAGCPQSEKVFPLSETAYIEPCSFWGCASERQVHRTDVASQAQDRKWKNHFVVLWDSLSRISAEPRQNLPREEYYRGLLTFAEYWDKQLEDFAPTSLPDRILDAHVQAMRLRRN